MCVMHTEVCITIDTEFSIAGAFGDMQRRPVAEPIVWCDVNGRSEGLGFLLACFKKYRISATFFVEALNRYYFTHDPMKEIAYRILEQGHEVQLHAHPCWAVFQHEDWRERVRKHPRQDDFFGRSEDSSLGLIKAGLESFADWGVPAPQVFRSGSLQHDEGLYRALERAGVPYSSNVGLAIFDSGNPAYQLYTGRHLRHGVLECPVLTFCDWHVAGRRHLKSLTISGTSFNETRTLLENAHSAGVEQVVILTHPFEYVQSRDLSFAHARRHAVNQQRLKQLCSFLDNNRDRFSAVGMAQSASRVKKTTVEKNILLDGARWQAVGRMATQVSYDKIGNFALACTRLAPQQ